MVYASPFLLTTVEGIFGAVATPTEIWRCTWKIRLPNGVGVDTGLILSYLTAISDDVATFHALSGGIGAGSDCRIASLAGAIVGVDGKYLGGADQPTTRYTYPTPPTGTGAIHMPLSTACCVTLRTDLLRGRGSHGRFYWPAGAMTLDAPTMTIGATRRQTIANGAKTMLDQVNDESTSRWGDFARVSVMSNLGSGTTGTVLRAEVGARLDSQERREASIPEAYVGTDLEGAAAMRTAALRDLAVR